MFEKELEYLRFHLGLCLYLVEQVRTVERCAYYLRASKPDLAYDVVLHLLCCGSRERCNRHSRKHLRYEREPQIIRSEVMPPLGYAVCLIYGKERYGHCFEAIQKLGHCKSFRCYVEQLDHAVSQSAIYFRNVLRSH